MAAVGHGNAHWRPPEEQNAHKVTLGVREGAPADVLAANIGAAADEAGISVKVIASGTGGWRYLDVVSSAAGKLESLEYVRAMLGFEPHATVTAGDSGNDILLLSGPSRAVVVGNAQPDLVMWADKQQEQEDEQQAGQPQAQQLLLADGRLSKGSGAAVRGGRGGKGRAKKASQTGADTPTAAVAVAEPPVRAASDDAHEDAAAGVEQQAAPPRRRLYRAQASNAWGILEGLQYFGCA